MKTVHDRKLASALRLYREDRITKERAAEIAGASLYEIIDAVRQQRIPAHLTIAETLEEIERVMERHRTIEKETAG